MQSNKQILKIPFYEALWFVGDEDFTEEFYSLKELIHFYNEHKNDKEKYGWKITKRGYGFKVLRNYLKTPPTKEELNKDK